jgi:CubicO group peptidase (beta-lactamase class C family)
MKPTLIIILLFLSNTTVFGQVQVQKVDSLMKSLFAKEKINGNILIAEKGQVIYQKSFGIANAASGKKLNSQSIFELASCSKQFTAMAIMILMEKRKLQLDDPMANYIPELSNYPNVTVRHLLHHTSGLPDYMALMDEVFDKSKIATNQDIIRIFHEREPALLFEPNTKYEYSNTGYAMLASIIEKASGQSYAEFLKTHIFRPLKMKNSFVYTRRFAPQQIKNYAYGYVYSDSLKTYVLPDELAETKMVIWLDGIVGDGCVNSTVPDLLKWDRALYTNQLLSTEHMELLFQVATLQDQTQTDYGFGWGIENHAEFGKIVSHSGGWPGYVTYIERHLTHDKTIILLQNHENVSLPIRSVRNILYNKPLPTPKIRTEISLPVDQLQMLTGVYEMEPDFEMKISIDKEQLYVQLTGQEAFPIYAETALLFFLKIVDAQLEFVKNDTGEVEKVFLIQNNQKMEAKRMK